MKNVTAKIKGSLPVITLKYILSSKYFPFFTAAVVIALTYLTLDIVTICYMIAVIACMLLLLDDLTPLFVQFLFLNVLMSAKNSPSTITVNDGPLDYFTRPEIIAVIVVLAVPAAVALIWRIVQTVKAKNFKPNAMFWGMCVLSVFFLLNGAGSADYTFKNLYFGAVMAVCILGVYVFFCCNVKLNSENFEKLAFGFFALSALLVIELFVRYMQIIPEFKQFISGELEYNSFKEYIYFGWGIWNTAGMLFCICIPAVFLLATRYKHGWILILYATLLALCAVLTWSRQAILGVVAAYPASAVAAMIKGKNRKANIIAVCSVVFVACIAVLTVALTQPDLILNLIGGMSQNLVDGDGGFDGNGRMEHINEALNFFAANPFFGSGFFMPIQDTVFNNLDWMPVPACNTLAEIIGACGIFGIAAYCVHRVQTIIAFAENPSADKFFTGMIIVTLLIMSLVDNHIFYILPTVMYGGLLVFVCEGRKN